MELAKYCNECCRKLERYEYVLNKRQFQQFSKRLKNELSKLPKTDSGYIYNWILKPRENTI